MASATTVTILTTADIIGTTRDMGRKMSRAENSRTTILISTRCPLTPLQRQLSGNCDDLEDDCEDDGGVDEGDGVHAD